MDRLGGRVLGYDERVSNPSLPRDDSEDIIVLASPVDMAVSSPPPHTALMSASAAQTTFLAFDPHQRRPSMPLGRERAVSDAEGLVGRSRSKGSKLESKIHAFTSNLRKHHAVLTNGTMSSTEGGRPAPPPKPDALRAPPSPTHGGNRSFTTPNGSPQSLAPRSPVAVSPASSTHSGNLMVPGQFTLPMVGGVRNSFQMPNTPSISAALHFMRDTEDQEKALAKQQKREQEHPPTGKKEKRRSADILKSVPENSAPHHSVEHAVPFGEEGVARPRLGLSPSPSKTMKRRSASLGDVFKGGWTPAMALASTGATIPKDSKPLNAAQAMKNRPPLLHRRTPSGGSGSSLERTPSNSSPLNPATSIVAKTYQYVNAELLDDDRPSAFVHPRPGLAKHATGDKLLAPLPEKNYTFPSPHHQTPPPPTFTVTPASAAAPLPFVPSKPIGGIIAPLLPPRKKVTPPDADGDSSGTESSLSGYSKGVPTGTNLKGRLAALSGVAAPNGTPATRGTGTSSAPPIASPNKQSGSSGTDSSSSRALSNSSNQPPNPPPQRAAGRQPAVSQSGQPSAQLAASSMAATAGSLGATAGGMAMNFGRRGLERVGNFLGHRTGMSGNWANMTGGYTSTGEDVHGRGSSDGSPPGATMFGQGAGKVGTRMLGPMMRPPTRPGKGAVFGRNLQDCVAETRIGAGEWSGAEEQRRGEGLWVTALVRRCISHLTHWGLEEEGLFRITGRATHVAKIRGEFDTGADYDLREAHPSDLDPHAVSSVLKAYLRERERARIYSV